jgi:hypothetical protein
MPLYMKCTMTNLPCPFFHPQTRFRISPDDRKRPVIRVHGRPGWGQKKEGWDAFFSLADIF